MIDQDTIRQALINVVDPETGMDVISMAMVENIAVKDGTVHLSFTPTSPVCPLAFKLSNDIVTAVRAIPEVDHVRITVLGHRQSREIEALFNHD